MTSPAPPGVRLLRIFGCRAPRNRTNFYRGFTLLFTFLCYTAYHLSRRPSSVVRSVLHRNCSQMIRPPEFRNASDTWCSWAPFDGANYHELFGALDYAYLFSYAMAMFVSGHIAERVNLRLFLSTGMVLSGLLTILFGLGHYWRIHSLSYYVAVQVFGGMFQATGWPCVVACVGNWFGRGKRGFIMGVWNSHTSVGNILGSLISGVWVDTDWGLSFIVPGLIIMAMSGLVWLFLVPYPEDVSCDVPDYVREAEADPLCIGANGPGVTQANGPGVTQSDCSDNDSLSASADEDEAKDTEHHSLLRDVRVTTHPHHPDTPISISQALKIPGVIEFSLCLFFAKLVSYTFLFWLPKYISSGTQSDPEYAADLAALFDVGGIVGGILAGVISDYTGARATTCMVMLALAAPMLYVYEMFGNHSLTVCVVLLLVCGGLVNGPYALITTAVSADLGTHQSLHGNAKALATVTAIIDGTGSMGAALGPLLTGLLVPTGWPNVFVMLIAADVAALMLLVRVVLKELRPCCRPTDDSGPLTPGAPELHTDEGDQLRTI